MIFIKLIRAKVDNKIIFHKVVQTFLNLNSQKKNLYVNMTCCSWAMQNEAARAHT